MAGQSPTRTGDVQGEPELVRRIRDRSAPVAVIGAGHVGLPLAIEIARAGFKTVVYDTDPGKVDLLNSGRPYIADVLPSTLNQVVTSGHLAASVDPDVLSRAEVIIICVPTPLHKSNHPDNSFIVAAVQAVIPRMRAQQLIVLESTTFPGFTKEVLLPRLLTSGLELDRDFFVAFSPERVDPGNRSFGTKNTPKVIGGASPVSLNVAMSLYRTFIDTLVPVSSTDVAEMVKLLENTFRAVNIGLVNELAMMCRRLGLDTWEVIDAASTKPFGFMPFHPGPGLGGHCIPVDPLLLSWKLGTLEYNARFIHVADEINRAMPEYVVSRIGAALNDRGKAIKGSRIMIVGVTYKRNVADVRESPAIDIMSLLEERGARVGYHDPLVPVVASANRRWHGATLDSVPAHDAVVIVTDHTNLDYVDLVERAQLVVDCRNATRELRATHGQKIVTL